MDGDLDMKIGVLALQGDFAKHEEMLKSLGCDTVQVRTPADLAICEALVIPGGESTALFRQIEFIDLRAPLIEFSHHKNIFGTCAGLILMSSIINGSSQKPLGILDISIERNAFGRQLDSFKTRLILQLESEVSFEAFLIRAPEITAHGSTVEVLSEFEGKPVLIRQGKHLGACFHPELTPDEAVHRYFLNMI